jgi:phage replication initiation protein
MDQTSRDVVRQARGVDATFTYTSAHAVAASGARLIADLLGFVAGPADERGMDYYTARAALMQEGAVVGWVLAGGKSTAQSGTVHVNIFGSACLHVSHEKWQRVREFASAAGGWITRCDLAVDLWDGYTVEQCVDAYQAGEFKMGGRQPSQDQKGSWVNGHSRTFYVGTRDAGKMFRWYEKGDELFGHESNSPWIRGEVEFRNNNRVLDWDMLARPADFFAGAYGFCARVLNECGTEAAAQSMPREKRLLDATVEAAVVRVCKWVKRSAGPALAQIFFHGGDLLADFVANEARIPARLLGFDRASIVAALGKVADGLAPSPAPFANGAA